MKHVLRIFVALAFGLVIALLVWLVCTVAKAEAAINMSLVAGFFTAFGCWEGIGMRFFVKDES